MSKYNVFCEGEQMSLETKDGKKFLFPKSPTKIKVAKGEIEGYPKLIVEWDASPKVLVEKDPF